VSSRVIELQNVSFAYPEGKVILQDISLDLKKNDLIIIQGKSGAGKSTFLKLFNRFCDTSEGTILFHGKELEKYGIEEIRSSIIYLPQLPYMIDGSVEENLTFPFSFHSHRGKYYNPEQAREWFGYFQLDVPFHQEALKLSVGQRQRIALIRSILLQPEVLLLDEPGSALDSANKRLIEQKIESLIDSSNITVIMATHSDVTFTPYRKQTFMLKDKNLSSVP
jgi:putative ABC transport system ATP-binding protein